MGAVNAENERLKRRYFLYLREAEGLSASTIENAARAIAEFEDFVGRKSFRQFQPEDAIRFKKTLLAGGGRRAAEQSHRSTVHGKLQKLSKLIRWLSTQDGFRSRIRGSDAGYFNLSLRDRRIGSERIQKPTPTLEQAQHVVRSMPATTHRELRDRAVMACVLLTGIRVSALISLKLKHVRADGLGIDQDAAEVHTKFGRTLSTFFFPVGDDIKEMFADYVRYLRQDLLWGAEEPLFPGNGRTFGKDAAPVRERWRTAEPVRNVFRRAFAAASLPYFSPHSFRRTLMQFAERQCRTPEELKAWSQNLGHEEVLTSFRSYGAVSVQRQSVIMLDLAGVRVGQTDSEELVRLLKTFQKQIEVGSVIST